MQPKDLCDHSVSAFQWDSPSRACGRWDFTRKMDSEDQDGGPKLERSFILGGSQQLCIIHIYICIYIYIFTSTYTSTYTYTYHIYIYTYNYVYIYICMCIYYTYTKWNKKHYESFIMWDYHWLSVFGRGVYALMIPAGNFQRIDGNVPATFDQQRVSLSFVNWLDLIRFID